MPQCEVHYKKKVIKKMINNLTGKQEKINKKEEKTMTKKKV